MTKYTYCLYRSSIYSLYRYLDRLLVFTRDPSVLYYVDDNIILPEYNKKCQWIYIVSEYRIAWLAQRDDKFVSGASLCDYHIANCRKLIKITDFNITL